jgi:hypothetical protein
MSYFDIPFDPPQSPASTQDLATQTTRKNARARQMEQPHTTGNDAILHQTTLVETHD